MFEDTGLYSQMRILVVSQKSCIFYVSYKYTDIQQYEMRKHVFVQNGYDTRIQYKDTIHTERIGYDTRIQYRDTIQSTIQGYC